MQYVLRTFWEQNWIVLRLNRRVFPYLKGNIHHGFNLIIENRKGSFLKADAGDFFKQISLRGGVFGN